VQEPWQRLQWQQQQKNYNKVQNKQYNKTSNKHSKQNKSSSKDWINPTPEKFWH